MSAQCYRVMVATHSRLVTQPQGRRVGTLIVDEPVAEPAAVVEDVGGRVVMSVVAAHRVVDDCTAAVHHLDGQEHDAAGSHRATRVVVVHVVVGDQRVDRTRRIIEMRQRRQRQGQ